MRFFVNPDTSQGIHLWVIPDNPIAISRIHVAVNGDRVAEFAAWITDDAIRLNGWHSTGQCVFRLSDHEVPELNQAHRIEIFDVDTNVLIYRRVAQEKTIYKKVVLIDTSITKHIELQSNMFDFFQQSYLNIDKMPEEVLQILFGSPWLTSSLISGSVLIPRYDNLFSNDNLLTCVLVHDPYVEMATRLVYLRERSGLVDDPDQTWRLGLMTEAASYAGDHRFDDHKSLKRFFGMMPESVYRLLYNPLSRQFGTRLPDDRFSPGNSIVAIEVLARIDIVGHFEFFEAFATTLFDRLGIDAAAPSPEPIADEVRLLSDRLRTLKVAQEMLVFDVAMTDSVRHAVSKSWR